MKEKKYSIYLLIYAFLPIINIFLFERLIPKIYRLEDYSVLLIIIFVINILANTLFFKKIIINEIIINKNIMIVYYVFIFAVLTSCLLNFPFKFRLHFFSNLILNLFNFLFFIQMNIFKFIYDKSKKPKREN